jgi:hypothetical protein
MRVGLLWITLPCPYSFIGLYEHFHPNLTFVSKVAYILYENFKPCLVREQISDLRHLYKKGRPFLTVPIWCGKLLLV